MWLAVSLSLSPVVFPPHHWGWAYFSQRSRTWLGLKAGTDWEQGLVGADSGLLMFWIECLRLLLRSRPWCSPTLPPEHMLALLRSRCPLGGGSAVSSPSSCLSATWKSRVYQASQTRELFSSLDCDYMSPISGFKTAFLLLLFSLYWRPLLNLKDPYVCPEVISICDCTVPVTMHPMDQMGIHRI